MKRNYGYPTFPRWMPDTTLHKEDTKMNRIETSVGIDLAKRSTHKAVVIQHDTGGQTSSKRAFSFSHDLEGLNALIEHIVRKTGMDSLEQTTITMEPTSGVWEPVASFLKANGAQVFYTRTDIVAALRKAQNKFAKTDRVDARTLGGFTWSMPERMIPYNEIEPRVRKLRNLSNQRRSLVDETTDWKNRFISHLEPIWLPVLMNLDKEQRFSKLFRAFIQRFVVPGRLIQYGRTRFETWLEKHSHGNTSHELVDLLWEGTEKAAALLGFLETQGALVFDTATLKEIFMQDLRIIAFLEKETERSETLIKEARKDIPECDLVQELPGVGDAIAPTITGVLMPVDRFPSCKKCGAYTGYTSRKKQSGDHDIKGLKITKTGNSNLKRDLVLAADTAMHNDPELAAFAIRLLEKGKHYNKVRVAVGRKIAVRAYALLKKFAAGQHNVHYRWRTLEGTPISQKEAKVIAQFLWTDYKRQHSQKKKPARSR